MHNDSKLEQAKKWFRSGLEAMEMKNYEKAEESFLNSLKLVPNRSSSLINLSTAQIKLGKYGDALNHALCITKVDQDDREAWINCAIASVGLYNFIDARYYYRRAINLQLKTASIYNGYGEVLLELGQIEDALENFTLAKNMDSQFALAYFNSGVSLIKLNRLKDAALSFEDLLKIAPDNVEAYNNLGIIFKGIGEYDNALDKFETAIKLSPVYIDARFNRAKLLEEMGRVNEAVAGYKEVIVRQPCHLDSYYCLGLLLQKNNQNNESLGCFEKIISMNPSHVKALVSRGDSLRILGKPHEAIISYDKAIAISPNYAFAYYNRGVLLRELGRFGEALDSYDKAISINPNFTNAHYNRGIVLYELGRSIEATEAYKAVIKLKPKHARAYLNLGVLQQELGRSEEALACYEKAIEIDPGYFEAYNNLGCLLEHHDRLEDAICLYDKAIALREGYADALANKAYALLKTGNYAQGWDLYERRWQAEDFVSARLSFTQPMWGGERSDNKLLIWAEQGVGDQVLYGGLLPELAGYPQHKVVALDKRLIPLFERSMPGLEFVGFNRIAEILDFAEQIPMGSLPRLLRPSKESFEKVKSPYLMADQVRVESLRPLIARAGKRVCGVSWLSKNTKFGQHKSLSLEQMLLPLKGEGLHFVNLQYGDTQEEREALQREHGIEVQDVQAVDNYNDIDGLAALIEACDVVLTTSNTTAHLAGALGKETLLLLPYGRGRLWYWSRKGAEQDGQGERSNGNNGDRSVWYPSIRIYTQDQPGQWQGALADIRSYLEIKSWTPSRSS